MGAMVVLIPKDEASALALQERVRAIGDPSIIDVRAYEGRR